ncbi:MAG: hypothetical protein Q8P76_04425 [bacterium]|nr:hypothetical protein [bacterium]
MADHKTEVVWRAPEFEYHSKGASWYWSSIGITLLLVAFSVWQKNLLFALFVVIAEVAIWHWARQVPKTLEFRIDQSGITIGHIKFYSYEELEGYLIREASGHRGAELIIRTSSRMNPFRKINILEKDIPDIKKILPSSLKEIEYEDSLADTLLNRIGF